MNEHQIGPTLDEGEDPFPPGWEQSDDVKRCTHDAWESVLVRPHPGRLEECIRCIRCHAPRCGYSRDTDPCVLVRHHTTHHVSASGHLEPIGGYKCANGPGCGCGARRAA